jgi:hypothetical protein
VAADEVMLHRVRVGVISFTEDGHRAIMKAAHVWGRDTSATDKALRNCLLGSALSVIETMGIQRRNQMNAFWEVSVAAFSGFALGRDLVGTETARPSYSSSEAEEKNNAVRIHDRSQAWPFDTLIEAFRKSDSLMHVVHSLANSLDFRDLVGARRSRAMLLTHVVGGVAVAMAEDDLFGPFTSQTP